MPKVHTSQFSVSTRGKGTYEITEKISAIVNESAINEGAVTIFVQHTLRAVTRMMIDPQD